MAYTHQNAAYFYYEPMINQYAMSAPQYTSALTIDCNQPIYISHSPMNYNTPTQYPVYPEGHGNMSPISPLTPLSAASLSPPPSESYGAPSACSRAAENVCHYEGCTSTGKFKRRTDLQRHIRTQHEAENNKTDCRHAWCGRTGNNGFSRLDHYREHLREVHREDIPYKSRRESSNRLQAKNKHRSKASITSFPRQTPSAQHV